MSEPAVSPFLSVARRAADLVARGEGAAATELLDRLGRTRADAPDLLTVRAMAAYRAGRPDLGLAAAWAAANASPADAQLQALVAHGLEACGEPVAALDRLERAIDLAPDDVALRLRHLKRLAAHAPETAAAWLEELLALLAPDRAAALVPLLGRLGRRAVGACRLEGTTVHGWIAGPGEVAATLPDGSQRPIPLQTVAPGLRRFALPWPDGVAGLAVTVDGHPLAGGTLQAPATSQPTAPDPASLGDAVAVVVPVYADFQATRACLAALEASRGAIPFEITVVDDATPEPDLAAHLREGAAAGRFRLLVNARNQGFTASVNRALAASPGRDAVLLNADTLVAPGWLDRLHAALHAAPDIATATPLTNDGQHCSFPRPQVTAPMPNPARLAALDAAAARVNAGLRVDLPVGAGFCLAIRAACRSAIGALDTAAFGRGYGEETDFCLRASARGWRHVCAADVFVAHHGTLSFGPEKTALVRRNMALIRARHPAYQARMDRFLAADPLAPARHRLERATLARGTAPRTLAIGIAADHPDLTGKRQDHLLTLRPVSWQGGTVVAVESLTREGPHALRYRLPEDRADLHRDLARLGVTRLAYYRLDLPGPVLGALAALGLAVEIHVEEPWTMAALGGQDTSPRARLAARLAARAKRLTVRSESARRALAAAYRRCRLAEDPASAGPPAEPATPRPGHVAVPVPATLAAHARLLALARAAGAAGGGQADPHLRLFLFGESADAAALLRTGRAHVLGPVAEDERPALARALGCTAALALLDPLDPTGRAVDGAARLAARVVTVGGPAAAERAARHAGLCLRPEIPVEALAEALLSRAR